MSYVCDSFKGLPPGDKLLHPRDHGWNLFPYLEESAEEVAKNFRESGVLDSNVVFAKGFFNETMPPLASRIKRLAVMRLDGDMYESTVDCDPAILSNEDALCSVLHSYIPCEAIRSCAAERVS